MDVGITHLINTPPELKGNPGLYSEIFLFDFE